MEFKPQEGKYRCESFVMFYEDKNGTPKYLYGNPETIFINKERSTCKRCAFLDGWEVFGKQVEFCMLKKKTPQMRSLWREEKGRRQNEMGRPYIWGVCFPLFGAVIAIAVGEIEAYSKCNSNGGVQNVLCVFLGSFEMSDGLTNMLEEEWAQEIAMSEARTVRWQAVTTRKWASSHGT